MSVESKLECARSLESSRRTPTKRERERELNVLGGDVLKRDEKDFRGDILMRKTQKRAKKREREKSRGEDFASAKSRTTHACERFFFLCEVIFGSLKKKGSQRTNFSFFFSSSESLLARFWFELVALETFASLKERDNYALNTHQPWPKERNRREKPRNRYVAELANERVERERERETLSLSSFALFLARPVVFI